MRVIKNKLFVIISILLLSVPFIQIAQASALTGISDTMTNLNATGTSNHTIAFTTPTGIANTNTITLTFPGSSFTMGGSLTGVTIADGAGADNAVTSASWSAPTLTITASASSIVAAGHVATIKIPSTQITNPAANTYVVSIGGSFGDTGKFAVVIVSSDVVAVSTTVDPSLTFELTNNTITLLTAGSGNPTASATAYNGSNTLRAGTNAASGYMITYLGTTLTSGLNTITALSAGGASSIGSEQFGINLKDNTIPNIGAEKSGGTGAAVSGYGTADSYKFVPGVATDFASAAAPSADTTFTVSYIANVASDTEAGAYSTNITYICTGRF